MQSTGQTSTQELTLVPKHGYAITKAMGRSLGFARVILLTGATGLLGSAVLRRLVARGEPVRCLVRDARRLGPERMHVQLASGDLADPGSFRTALRGIR